MKTKTNKTLQMPLTDQRKKAFLDELARHVRNRVRSAFNRNREFERGKVSAKTRIGESLANGRETGVLGNEGEEDD